MKKYLIILFLMSHFSLIYSEEKYLNNMEIRENLLANGSGQKKEFERDAIVALAQCKNYSSFVLDPKRTIEKFTSNGKKTSTNWLGFSTTRHYKVHHVEDELVGIVCYDMLSRTLKIGPFSHDFGLLMRVHVLAVDEENCHEQICAYALLKFVLDHAQKNGAHETMLVCQKGDSATRELCASLGFTSFDLGNDKVNLYKH